MKWLILFLLIGCKEDWSHPYQKCLEHETYTYTTMMYVGKSFIPQVRTGTRCSSYSESWYIDRKAETFRLVVDEQN